VCKSGPGKIQYISKGCIDDEPQFKTAKGSQASGDATVPKRFFRDNFVIFRRRSKRIAFLESVNFYTCVYMQIFNCCGHVTTFRHPSGAYISQMPGHRLSRLAKGTPSEAFHRYHWFGVKLFPVGCMQDSRRVP